jgi:hypothetical protein
MRLYLNLLLLDSHGLPLIIQHLLLLNLRDLLLVIQVLLLLDLHGLHAHTLWVGPLFLCSGCHRKEQHQGKHDPEEDRKKPGSHALPPST